MRYVYATILCIAAIVDIFWPEFQGFLGWGVALTPAEGHLSGAVYLTGAMVLAGTAPDRT